MTRGGRTRHAMIWLYIPIGSKIQLMVVYGVNLFETEYISADCWRTLTFLAYFEILKVTMLKKILSQSDFRVSLVLLFTDTCSHPVANQNRQYYTILSDTFWQHEASKHSLFVIFGSQEIT